MKKENDRVVVIYFLSAILFYCTNLITIKDSANEVIRWPIIKLIRSGKVIIIDTQLLKQSISRLPATKILRMTGNSIRLVCGTKMAWSFWSESEPTMLFGKSELWVSEGISAPSNLQVVQNTIYNILKIQNLLNSEGWKLVVVPVPTKVSIYRERCQWPILEKNLINREPVTKDKADEFYDTLIKGLEAQNIRVVNLQSEFRNYLKRHPDSMIYPRGESHWSGLGLRLAAQATAMTLEKHFSFKRRDVSYSFLEVEEIADLAQAFDPLPILLGPLKNIYKYKDQLVNGEQGKGYIYPSEPDALIVVVGTSYSGQFTWHIGEPVGFAWVLGLNLENIKIQNAAEAGQGSTFAMQKFLRERGKIILQNDKTIKPYTTSKVLVWEFPVRDIGDIAILNPKVLK